MECLYPKDCINAESHLDSTIKKRSRDISIDIPDIQKLNISDPTDIVVRHSKKIKIDTLISNNKDNNIDNKIDNKIDINKEPNKKYIFNNNPIKDKILHKIECIEKKLRLFKMCSTKYIDHLQDELDELKNIM
tara:strand:+ start:2194 stop:2592 length:399 start_codon:yes stop_codon:yes gene_type:complete